MEIFPLRKTNKILVILLCSPGNTGCGGVVRIDKCDLGDFGEFHKFKC